MTEYQNKILSKLTPADTELLMELSKGNSDWYVNMNVTKKDAMSRLWGLGLLQSRGFKRGKGNKNTLNATGFALVEELSGK